MKSLKISELSTQEVQKYLQGAIAPRPIALASTIDKQGRRNVSPFSFFNVFSSNPPILIFSPARRVRDNTTKHTLENVLEVPEVVIGVCSYNMVQQVSLSSTEYLKEENEFIKAGFTENKSSIVKPSLIKESPVNFECKVIEIKSLGNNGGAGNLVICQVLMIHVKEEILDDEGNIVQEKIDLISRLGGNWYGRTTPNTLFTVPKPLRTKGIGFDKLPKEILESKVLTANDLGKLANVESLSKNTFTADKQAHKQAQELLNKDKILEAWIALSKGIGDN